MKKETWIPLIVVAGILLLSFLIPTLFSLKKVDTSVPEKIRIPAPETSKPTLQKVEDCAYVKAEGPYEIQISWYKKCSRGECKDVRCDYITESRKASEGSIYNCHGICR